MVETCPTVPAFQSGFTTWNISMASGELAFEPKPLSVRVRNVPSFRFLIPDSPCTGWPLNGRLMPVGRGAALSDSAEMPGTLAGASISLARRPGEAAGDLQVGRRIGGRGNERHGRQDRVTFQHRREFGLRRRRHREAKGCRRRDRKSTWARIG